ncbi:hydroxymethylglutaryl-CoA synthase [Corynebacterium terpenotabidum]|uniref:Hydroxymethylglutaryl-CoA synthase n=1 Tax=Corynebacterium terpenotabidum Y-11 TaxID=1200352 RepID=S4XKW8_9CORY|nr:hydroxymethylglutaryl-CoA synthase [Corynebacterium terpenotabidum]AGP31238.1 hydroxymethylglutaryl-CoA synthase [Corynebacterium terpenotabidum Y-11]
MTAIGIHDLELATGHHVLELTDLAESQGVVPGKYILGLGQSQFSVLSEDEDIVTMGAAAALPLLERNGIEGIRTLLFATESGVDQSKAAGVAALRLLGLPSGVRTVEMKQACYGGTAALQAAIGIVARAPEEKVLVIASDNARYLLDSPGEPTQGAGAVAMLVSADPALLEIEPINGISTTDVDDFWRPNDSTTAVVDGHLSVGAYLDALSDAWKDLEGRGGPAIGDIDRILYHQPYTKMAKKAQQRLREVTGEEISTALNPGDEVDGRDTGLETGSRYNRRLGNSYTASLYAGLASLLDHDDELAGKRIGLFSYGSGCVSEFFTGIVQEGYREVRAASHVEDVLDARVPVTVAEYRDLHNAPHGTSTDQVTPAVTTGPFRFAGVADQARRYEVR